MDQKKLKKRYTIHTNLNENKELTVGSIEEPFKTDVANELKGETDSAAAKTKIENLLKTKDTYSK